jgi:enterochelin esterase-like enzyme
MEIFDSATERGTIDWHSLGAFRDDCCYNYEMGGQMIQHSCFGVRNLHKQSRLMFIGILVLSLGMALCMAIYSLEQGVIAQGKDNPVNSSSQNVILLEAGKSVEREIKGGEVHTYQINLRTGESVWGEVVQRALIITGFFPDGSKIRSYDSPRDERKTFEIVAEAPGVYRLEIKTANNGGAVVYKLHTKEVLPFAERLQYVAPEKYQSPRLTALGKELLAGNKSAVDKFWQEVEQSGTPLVEPIEGDDKNFLVTFLWRATFETWNVLVVWRYGIDRPDDYKMLRLANSNIWYKTLRLPRGARFYYLLSPNDRLVSGGKDAQREATAQIDPLNPRRSSNDPNLSKYDMASIAELPGAHPQEWADRRLDVATGKVEKHRFKSALMKNERDIAIYTPANYQSSDAGSTPYDLLVLFDGPDYQSGVPAPVILDNLIAEKRIAPLIAVLVSNSLLPGRSRELSCNPQFAEFLAKELVPWVRERYRVTRDPGHVTVGGLSLGGLAAAYVALRNPEIFGNVLAQSGSFWWAPKRNEGEEPNWLARQFIESRKLPLRFYLEAGIFENDISGNGGGILENTRHLRDVLRANGYEVHYREFAGGHDFLSWRGSLADGLLALARMQASNRK